VKKLLTALAITTALVLTGCSNVDTALTLGDVKITTTELTAKIDTILTERAKVDTSQMQLETGETLLRSQLQTILFMEGFSALAEELKIEVSNSEVAARRGQILEQIGGEDLLPQALVSASVAPEDLDPYLRSLIITEKVGQALIQAGVAENEVQLRLEALFVAKINSLKIEINPRYGKWDPETGQIIPEIVASDAVTPSTE
jgi:outer membrane murein-binding lipoprotein Lpp